MQLPRLWVALHDALCYCQGPAKGGGRGSAAAALVGSSKARRAGLLRALYFF